MWGQTLASVNWLTARDHLNFSHFCTMTFKNFTVPFLNVRLNICKLITAWCPWLQYLATFTRFGWMKQKKMLKSVYGSLHKLFTPCFILRCLSLSPHLLTLTDTGLTFSSTPGSASCGAPEISWKRVSPFPHPAYFPFRSLLIVKPDLKRVQSTHPNRARIFRIVISAHNLKILFKLLIPIFKSKACPYRLQGVKKEGGGQRVENSILVF